MGAVSAITEAGRAKAAEREDQRREGAVALLGSVAKHLDKLDPKVTACVFLADFFGAGSFLCNIRTAGRADVLTAFGAMVMAPLRNRPLLTTLNSTNPPAFHPSIHPPTDPPTHPTNQPTNQPTNGSPSLRW